MNRVLIFAGAVLGASSLLLIDSAIKGAALLLIATVVVLLLRRDSAATRHFVWLVAIVGLLVVPVFSAVLPQWRVLPAWATISTPPSDADVLPDEIAMTSVPVSVSSSPQAELPAFAVVPEALPAQGEFVADEPMLPIPDRVHPAEVVAEIAPPSADVHWGVLDLIPLVWAVGFAVLMLRLSAARLMLWSSERRGTVVAITQTTISDSPTESSGDRIVDAFRAACRQLGVRRRVRLLIHSERTIPVVWGIIRIRLLLPESARTWSDEQLQSVLLHELGHIKRGDAMTQLLAQLACALHWFNPAVWFASWRMHVERERACDDLVLSSGVKPSAYAEHLLDVATRLSPAKWTQACGLAMARKSSLEGRLRAVLNKKRNRRSVSAALGSVTLIAGVGIAVPLAMLRATDGALADEDAPVAAAAASSESEDDGDAVEAADVHDAMPSDTTAALLLKRWQALEERKSPISEASVARLRAAIDKWVNQPPAKADAAQVLALRDRNIDHAEHPTFEVAGWLSAIAAINRGPLQFAINGETRIGEALSEERQATLKFGPVAENGLRAAWSRYPERETYVVGDVVTSAVVIQNASDKTVEFTCPYSVDSLVKWHVTAQDGREIPAKTSSLRGSTPIFTWRLKPGEATSIGGRSVAIGVGARREKFDNFHITTVLDAKAGEDVTVRWGVREPIEMVTEDVSFKIVAPEDVPVWSTRRAGDWQLAGSVTMEVKQRLVHASDVSSTAVLTWPQNKDGGIARYEIWLAGDAFTNREPWMLAWERDATVLWTLKGEMQSSRDFPSVLATPAVIRRIDFSDPERITETTWRGLPEVLPDSIRAKLTEGFLPMKAEPTGLDRRQPGHRIFRAEDVRPVADLLSGKWIAELGDVMLSVTFSAGTNSVRWVAPNPRATGAGPIVETLTRLQSAGEDSVRLIRDGNSPAGRRPKLVARLRRGIGDTLLIRVFDRAAFSKDVDTSGIVLHRALAIAENVRPAAAPARPAAELKPEDRFAQTLFKNWQANVRTDGKIPGALIGRLGEMVEYFNQLNKGEVKELVAKYEALLPRFDATVDWSQADAVALLDDVAAVHSIPLLNTLNIAEQRVILTGEPLPPELVDAPWGEPADNGLRVAWHLSPRAKEYRLGMSLKSRILVHNSGEETVIFSMPSWQQSSTHTAHDDGNKAIKVSSTDWTTMASMKVVRLAPGAYYETPAPGIGLGPRTDDEDWAHIRPGAWIEAKEGDDVRLTPGLVEVRFSPRAFGTSTVDGRPTNTYPKGAAELWDRIVTERLDREMPLPAGAADRAQLLRRVVRDLYNVEPDQGEIDAYVADKSPGAVHPIAGRDLLKTRVQQGRKLSPFTGTLPSGDISFRVLAADPDAANRPRVATGPGYYDIADRRRLSISQSRNGNRRINSATIHFHRQYYYSDKGKPAPGPYAISLPEGRLTYAIVWDRDANELWVTQKGLTRRYDFSDSYEVKETQFKSGGNSNLPERFRNAVEAVLNLSAAPAQEPASQKASDAGLPQSAPAKLEPGVEATFKWGATVNGLRAALRFRRPGDEVNDLYVVVQNVSDAPIRLDDTAAANEHTLWIRLDGVIETALSGKERGMGDVILQPDEATFVRVFLPESKGADGHTIGWVMAENALKDPTWTMSVEFSVDQTSTGAWQGKLLTADTNGSEAAVRTTLKPPRTPAAKPNTSQSQSGTKLEPGREDNLQWGEPVKGLRAALIRPPALGSPESPMILDFQLVIQNVSDAPIHFVASTLAPNPRSVTVRSRRFGYTQMRLRTEDSSSTDVLLQPREITLLDMTRKGRTTGASISRNLDTLFTAEMTIEKAPPGAWTGKIVSAEMHAAFAAHGLLPKHKDAREVFKLWNQGARLNRTIPGGLIGLLADSVTVFTKSNPTWKTTPQLLQLLPRLDASRDFEPHDIVALLDEVAAIQASPVSALLENERAKVIRRGKPLPKNLTHAPWGKIQANGLRLAWLLEPQKPEVEIGTALKSRVLVHNSGDDIVVFRTRNWHQSNDHKAQDMQGSGINVLSMRSTMRTQVVPFRLNPGDYVELPAAAIGVGRRGDGGAGEGARVGSWIEAEVGDNVTFQPAPIALLDDRPRSQAASEVSWWHDLVTARLHREMPVPMDDEVRKRLVYHVGLDLGTSNSSEIVNAFLADRQPNALETLAKRLVEHSSPVPFAGTLSSGPTTFRVLAAGRKTTVRKTANSALSSPARASTNEHVPAARPAAATTNAAESAPAAATPTDGNKPATERPVASRKGPVRSANHSGSYQLKEGRRLVVCRPTVVKPWLAVVWDAIGPWPESRLRIYPKVSEKNYRNWAVVWEPDADDLWFVDDTGVTHVDVTNPAEVLTTRQDFDKPAVLIFKLPEQVRQEFQRLGFEIPRSKQSPDNHVTDGQAMLAGESLKIWAVEGTVTGQDGRPMTDVPIRIRTEYHPTIDVVTTKTDAKGNYRVNFRLDLRTIARYRGVQVEPVLDGFTERDAEKSGLFDALLHEGEKPHSVKVRRYPPMWITGSIAGENEVGPIRRFSKRDLILGQSARADFVMLPASVITGEIVDPDGNPQASRYVSVSAPDTVRPRGYETVASAQSDKDGRFKLTNIPANELLNFTSSIPGRNWEVSKSASQIFGPAATYRVRIVTGPQGGGSVLKVDRVSLKTPETRQKR